MTTVTASRSTSWSVLETVTSTRSTSWRVEALAQLRAKARDYAVVIVKWGGAVLIVEKVLHEALDIVSAWLNSRGR
jgi:hypothetical protein